MQTLAVRDAKIAAIRKGGAKVSLFVFLSWADLTNKHADV